MPNPAGGSMVGNAGDGYAKITLLSPIGTITYTPSTLTNQEVRAILTLNMSGSISSGENRIATGTTGREFFKVFSENMTGEIVEFIGENGYTGSAFITIDRIDKQPPRIINLTYTPKEETTAPVLVTIVFDEFTILSGWEKINDVTFTKIYTENKEEQIVFSDIVGNTNEIRIHISQIVSPSLDG
ncbi:MAG: hypothetical protein LBP53_06810 [Candidatus Peribacteria bacterium]|jgi:hypothetical protein|nr:hypothetical protein [Candidatus Peribacteria bacterium]